MRATMFAIRIEFAIRLMYTTNKAMLTITSAKATVRPSCGTTGSRPPVIPRTDRCMIIV